MTSAIIPTIKVNGIVFALKTAMCPFWKQCVCLFLRIIHRPHSQQFDLELLSGEQIIHMKTADGVLCGLSRVTGTLFQERDVCCQMVLVRTKNETLFTSTILWRRQNSQRQISQNKGK